VQDRAPQGRGACDLRKLETQTKTRVEELPELPKLPRVTIENLHSRLFGGTGTDRRANFGDFWQSWQFWQFEGSIGMKALAGL